MGFIMIGDCVEAGLSGPDFRLIFSNESRNNI